MTKKIFVVKTNEDLERCYPILLELRPHLSFADYLSIYQESHTANGYEIVAIEVDEKIQAVMGYRFLSDYIRGKHIYIDDLVSTEAARSKGMGAELLRFAENVAEQNKCKTLRLCTGIENEGGIKFYERLGWIRRAFAYTKKI